MNSSENQVASSPLSVTAGFGKSDRHLGNMTDDEQRRCLALGARIPSLRWWYSPHEKLGCSPRDAVDAGRFADVEALLPNAAREAPRNKGSDDS